MYVFLVAKPRNAVAVYGLGDLPPAIQSRMKGWGNWVKMDARDESALMPWDEIFPSLNWLPKQNEKYTVTYV